VSYGLDTSVLVRLLTGEPAATTARVRDRLLEAHRLRQPVVACDAAVSEAYAALKYHYDLDPADIRQSLLAMFASGLVSPEPGSAALAVLQSKAGGKAGFVDRLIQARYEADGMTTLTVDKAQARLGRSEYIG